VTALQTLNREITSQESLFIDYAKAFGIMAVVVGHYSWNPMQIYNPYIYHMLLFFIIGGITVKPIEDWGKWITKIAKRYILYLIVWYLVLAVCALAINELFATHILISFSSKGKYDYFIYPLTLNMHNNRLFLIAWFIVAYMLAISIFALVLTLLTSLRISAFRPISLLLGVIIGYVSMRYLSFLYQKEKYWLFNLICQVGVGYMFISIGHALRNHLQIFKNISLLFISIAIMVTFVGNGTFHPLFMYASDYPDGFYIHTLSFLSGCFGLLSISYILSLSVESRHLRRIGVSAKDIMTLHLLAFVIVDLILGYLNYLRVDQIDGITHFVSPSAWPLYIGFGLFLPILIRHIIHNLAVNKHVNFG
jgi:hypothetical protein